MPPAFFFSERPDPELPEYFNLELISHKHNVSLTFHITIAHTTRMAALPVSLVSLIDIGGMSQTTVFFFFKVLYSQTHS